jgi:hypothetical protein
VLFRLATGTEFKLREVPVAFDLVALELESEPLFGSTFFLTALVGTEAFDATEAPGFIVLVTLFAVSDELTEACFAVTWGLSAGSLLDSTTLSSILVHQQCVQTRHLEPKNSSQHQVNSSS